MAEHPRRTSPGPVAGTRVARWSWPWPVFVGLVASTVLGLDLASEPHFADESAYYSQSYYWDVLAGGDRDDPAWLAYPAYDLPPLPKYLIGIATRWGGYRPPRPNDARAWYDDTSSRFDPPGALTAARAPVVLVGAIGCVAVYGLGVLAAGRCVGALASLLLAANPLYRLHARRAMSDVPCEAFLLVGLFFALLAWQRTLSGRPRAASWLAATAAGVSAGLSVLSKLSGLLTFLVVVVWLSLPFTARRVGLWRRAEVAVLALFAAIVAAGTFVALDPFLTASPRRPLPLPLDAIQRLNLAGRARLMLALRFKVSADQKRMFPHNALDTGGAKAAAVAVQGFGRFGPFGPSHSDSTRRFDARQDWGALLWWPWVASGAWWAWRRGRAQDQSGSPPTAWAVLAHFGVALVVVTAYLPMAWDRYYLPIQAPSCLLASGAAVAAVSRLSRLTRGRPSQGGV